MTESEVQRSFSEVLTLWEKMKSSSQDEASTDANRFQTKFYELIEKLREWSRSVSYLPADLESAKNNAFLAELLEGMPGPLQIPFETELELLLEGTERVDDSTEQS